MNDNKTSNVSYGDLNEKTKLTIENVQYLQVVMSGDGAMDYLNKSIHIGGNVGDNVNLNTGDNVNQMNKISTNEDYVKLFAELQKDITEIIKDNSTKSQLEYFLKELIEAYEKKDIEKGSKLIGFLQKSLGNIGSLASVASLFGITLT